MDFHMSPAIARIVPRGFWQNKNHALTVGMILDLAVMP